MQNSVFRTRITRLYGSQASPVVLCMQNSVISTRITSLWRTLPSSVALFIQNSDFGAKLHVPVCPRPRLWFCACKTAWLASELLVSICSSPHFCFLHEKIACFGPELQVSMVPRPHLSFCAGKTAWLAPELLVSISPSPHLRFLLAKQRLLDQNYKSLWLPDLTRRFVQEKRRDYHKKN